MMRTPAEVGVASLRSIRAWPEQGRVLEVHQPFLLVHIRGGGLTDPTDLLHVRDNVFIAQTTGSGHFIQVFAAAQVNAMLKRFLAITLRGALS